MEESKKFEQRVTYNIVPTKNPDYVMLVEQRTLAVMKKEDVAKFV